MSWLTDFTGIGALISSVAAVIGALHARRAAKEVTPNHGSSLKDIVNLVDDKVDSLAHQLGEVKKDAATIHEDTLARLRQIEREVRNNDK